MAQTVATDKVIVVEEGVNAPAKKKESRILMPVLTLGLN